MKYTRILLFSAFVAMLGLTSCRETEKIDPNLDIPGLGGDDYVMNEVDEWLEQNYRKPYNVEVTYRWDAVKVLTSYDKTIVPIDLDQVIPMMEAIRDVWFEPFNLAAGEDFTKLMIPKSVVLAGSYEYTNGSMKLGQAEGGRNILLLGGNNFDPSNADLLRQSMHTIEHEFAHILHQTKMFDKDFSVYSSQYYDPSAWYNSPYTDPSYVYKLGFVRNYCLVGKDEDFADMASMILVYGKAWFENTVIATAATAAAGKTPAENTNAVRDLRWKEAIIVEYFKNSWGIQYYNNTATGQKGLEGYIQDAIAAVVARGQNP